MQLSKQFQPLGMRRGGPLGYAATLRKPAWNVPVVEAKLPHGLAPRRTPPPTGAARLAGTFAPPPAAAAAAARKSGVRSEGHATAPPAPKRCLAPECKRWAFGHAEFLPELCRKCAREKLPGEEEDAAGHGAPRSPVTPVPFHCVRAPPGRETRPARPASAWRLLSRRFLLCFV